VAAGTAVFAFESHKVGEGYVVEVQGTVGLGKMVYLGCVLEAKSGWVCVECNLVLGFKL
jgi:hypothetical protein